MQLTADLYRFVCFWIATLYLLITGPTSYYDDGTSTLSAITSNGIGRLNVNKTVDLGSETILGNVIVANSPQLLVSLLYRLYNDLVTRIHLAAQWSSYGHARKPLRVLNAQKDQLTANEQRSYYILSLPLRISIPLLVLMMILHWLISQSIFLGNIVNDYTSGGTIRKDGGYPVMGLGWSPLALILCLILGGLMAFGLWAYAWIFKFGAGIPFVRSSSAAISAACHLPAWDTNTAEKPVLYGVVQAPVVDWDGRIIPGRVCFTSGPAEPLIDGEVYI